MSRLVLVLATVLSGAPLVAIAFDENRAQSPRIGKIEIVVHEIFEEEPTPFTWAYRLANKLHIRTREEVIRRELLFASGDPVDPEALAQTERNLRALAFVRDARIETQPTEDGAVDVRVISFDAWTTVPQVRFAKVGSRILWTFGIAERNLLGWGKWLEASRRSRLDRDETVVFYFDPRLLGSRMQTLLSYSNQSDGSRGLWSLNRPFFALSTEWAFGLRLEGFDQLDPLYQDGERVADLRHVRRHGDLELARAVVRSGPSATRLHIAYRKQEDEVEGDLRDFGILQWGVSAVQHRFLKLSHVNRFETVEDFNLGYEASAFIGVSTPALGGEEGTVWFASLQGRRGIRLGEQHFLLGGAAWNARHRGGEWQNSLAAFRLDYVNKHSRRWTLVGTAQFQHGRNLDPEIQLRLGVESGLRGYPVRQFVGNRLVRFSVEERFFIADDVAQLVSFAAAAFFDTGFAWPEGQKIAWRDLKSNLGVSLLLGRNRLAGTTPGVRLDLAYALNPLAGLSRWQFSVGSRIAL